MLHPELPLDVSARIAAAVLARLRADADLAAFFAGRIDDYEVEAFSDGPEWTAPSLGVVLFSVDEQRSATGRQNLVRTTLTLALLTDHRRGPGTDDWLRQRVADRVKTVCAAGAGVLTEPGGTALTDALLSFQRLGVPVRRGDTQLLTLLRAEYRSRVREHTREIV